MTIVPPVREPGPAQLIADSIDAAVFARGLKRAVSVPLIDPTFGTRQMQADELKRDLDDARRGLQCEQPVRGNRGHGTSAPAS